MKKDDNMPGEKSTSQDKTVKAHSSLVSLDGTDDVEITGTGTAEDPTQMQMELDELRKQNERYKQQMAGWETQSKRNLTERDQLADRVARMEGHLSATANGKVVDKTSEKTFPEGKLKSALQKWLITMILNSMKSKPIWRTRQHHVIRQKKKMSRVLSHAHYKNS